ncbi:hypothetical protein ACGF7W_34415 [Streptomyces sp. NPDC048219]|uniref:hypothetical protein n=1 Tax=Streptomyces sp. NPDC048219 TaxID=3365517 RepID=UPI0037246B17
MKTAHPLAQAKTEILLHFDALYGEECTEMQTLIDAVADAAATGSPEALSRARVAFHLQKDALYGEEYETLSGLLDSLVAAAET